MSQKMKAADIRKLYFASLLFWRTKREIPMFCTCGGVPIQRLQVWATAESTQRDRRYQGSYGVI